MALGDKPTKQPEWNSDLTNQTEPTTGEKAAGFTVGGVAPSDIINWLFYTLYEWTRWVASYTSDSTGHVHDGGSNTTGTSPSAPKVDFNDHIDYGTHGSLEVTTDTSGQHTITHTATGTALISCDDLEVGGEISVDDISAPSGTLTIDVADDFVVQGPVVSTTASLAFVGSNAPAGLITVEANGTVTATLGFTGVSKTGTGVYTLNGLNVSLETWVVTATIEGTLAKGMITWFKTALGAITINTFDSAGSAADLGFSVVAYKID